ncbi:hypothetical protein B296_00012290 [Ensete ventricosum]|uniref:Uncharacterized protein n=1 Tax=Ensete ventricosum TaxID=4639 RepID=A0A426YPE7_ENSVE|nr:hypothetical protein B296_00012290 [Ensete ventricosum]
MTWPPLSPSFLYRFANSAGDLSDSKLVTRAETPLSVESRSVDPTICFTLPYHFESRSTQRCQENPLRKQEKNAQYLVDVNAGAETDGTADRARLAVLPPHLPMARGVGRGQRVVKRDRGRRRRPETRERASSQWHPFGWSCDEERGGGGRRGRRSGVWGLGRRYQRFIPLHSVIKWKRSYARGYKIKTVHFYNNGRMLIVNSVHRGVYCASMIHFQCALC